MRKLRHTYWTETRTAAAGTGLGPVEPERVNSRAIGRMTRSSERFLTLPQIQFHYDDLNETGGSLLMGLAMALTFE